tara:strand:+ start:3803 stop:4243 length:441 start_codon:yes stop_codon:yes gene_type:complete
MIFFRSLIISVIAIWFISTINSHAANEYLNSGGMSCSQGSIEPYAEWSEREGTSGSFYTNNGDLNTFTYPQGETDEWRAGVRFRWNLGSSCNKVTRKIMQENEMLKQELELLKLCGRYKNLELGPEFATVKRKCANIKPKEPLEVK